MTKKTIALIIALVLLTAMCATCRPAGTDHATEAATPQRLILATTTSTENSGLLDYILPDFEQQFNIDVQVVAVGTGQALALGEEGNADVLLVHARSREDQFMAEGHGVRREDVMYNDFVIVGPADDPAGIRSMSIAAEAFRAIAQAQAALAVVRARVPQSADSICGRRADGPVGNGLTGPALRAVGRAVTEGRAGKDLGLGVVGQAQAGQTVRARGTGLDDTDAVFRRASHRGAGKSSRAVGGGTAGAAAVGLVGLGVFQAGLMTVGLTRAGLADVGGLAEKLLSGLDASVGQDAVRTGGAGFGAEVAAESLVGEALSRCAVTRPGARVEIGTGGGSRVQACIQGACLGMNGAVCGRRAV